MPIPVCDRPPTRSVAIFQRVQDRSVPFDLLRQSTAQTPQVGIRVEPRHSLTTNASPDRSIAKARLSGLVAAANAELAQCSTLSQGWDGYSGEPIAPIAIKAAGLLIAALGRMDPSQRLTDIVVGPAPDGSLDLELRTDKRRLIVTIYSAGDNDLEVRTFRADSLTSEENHNVEADALVADVRWLLA